MKKILIISLFGLFVAHESSAMFARAVKTATDGMENFLPGASGLLLIPVLEFKEAIKKEKDLKKPQMYSYSDGHCDMSPDWAQKVVQDTKNWRALYRAKYQEISERFISDGVLVDVSGIDVTDRFRDEISEISSSIPKLKKRDLSETEKNDIRELFKSAGYSDSQIDDMILKIFIAHDKENFHGLARSGLFIAVKEKLITDIRNPAMAQMVLHEAAHHLGIFGHTIIAGGLFDAVREERCVELISMEQIAKIFGPDVLRTLNSKDFFIKEIREKLVEQGKDEHETTQYFEANLNKHIHMGYISRSQHVRNIVADYVARELSKETQGSLQELQEAEKAESTERV